MTPVIPSSAQPIADKNGFVTTVWQRFFNALNSASQPIQTVPIAPVISPFKFTASSTGALMVSGGTVTSISLTRGVTTIPTGQTSGNIPMSNGDIVSIAFSVAPNIAFVPA